MIHKAKKSLGLKTHFEFARAKKALGQNFLKSEPALRKIIEAGEIRPVRGREGSQRPSASNGVKDQDVVLEIGPGKGALTSKLLACSCQLIAVEKDKNLYELLKTKFEKEITEKKLILINEDILEFDPLLISPLAGGEKTKYKIIANIPYNITGAILKKFLTAELQPERMVLMVQYEVAQRIMGRRPASAQCSGKAKKESILSISVKAYGEPKMIMKVPARYFSPAPKVDSAVISIKNISRKNFTPSLIKEGEGGGNSEILTSPQPSPGEEREKLEEKFWEIVKAGFAHKRKKLSGNLKPLLKEGSLASFLGFGDKRAEDLTLTDWILLAKQ